MPVFVLSIKADLSGLESVRAIEHNQWCFSFQGPSGDVRDSVTLSDTDEIAIPDSRGTANLVMKFPGAQKESYASFVALPQKKADGVYRASNTGSYAPIIALECR